MISMISDKPFQRLHPVGLLTRLTTHKASGCLQVFTPSTSWSIYLEQGRLFYISNSDQPFDRLERYLRGLNIKEINLDDAVRFMRLVFEKDQNKDPDQSTLPAPDMDYQALCWLVHYYRLDPTQASTLVKKLAVELMGLFLYIKEGNYTFAKGEPFDKLPKFCQLDINALINYSRNRLGWKPDAPRSTSTALVPSNGGEQKAKNYLSHSHSTPVETEPNHSVSLNTNQFILDLPTQEITSSSDATVSYPTDESDQNKLDQPSNSTRKKTYVIACIDDSPAALRTIHSFLDDKGFSVLTIDNPVNALMQVIRYKPDLILLDVTMPNLDGYELCSLLRRHRNLKHTPVIMVTGNTGLLDRARAKLVGASGYLTKPFSQSDLMKIVFMHLS